MVIDFKAIKLMMNDFLDSLDHALCMNTQDPNYDYFHQVYGERIIAFDKMDPTSERMAECIYHFAKKALAQAVLDGEVGGYFVRDCIRLERVRVWETSSSWAEYEE